MNRTAAFRSILTALTMSVALAAQAHAQSAKDAPPPDDLFHTIAAQDAALFDAYNKCDLEKLGAIVADDLEFYHDQTGLSRGRQNFVDSIRKNICGKVHRDLVAGSLEVYPLHGYGAVEIGAHMFCDSRKTSKCDEATSGVAKFVMLWQNDGGAWKLTRVISYNHLSDWQRHDKP